MEEVPFEDRTVPRVELDWSRSFWWWHPISRAIHPAIRMSSLLPSIVAVLLMQFGVTQAAKIFQPTLSGQDLPLNSGSLVLDVPIQSPSIPPFSIDNLAFLTFSVLWLTLIASIFGGLIARRAAVELGQRTVAPWVRSIKLVASRTVSYVWATGIYIVALGGLLFPIAFLGWMSRLGSFPAAIAGVILVAVCIPLIFAVGRLAMGLIVCFPLSICAISIEKRADSFEGFSRSNAYFFQRPVLAILCVLLLALFGEVGAFLVNWTVQLGWGLIKNTYLSAGGSDLIESSYVLAGDWVATNLQTAFRFSYFWSAAAGLYLVLRRCVDNTDLDEMDILESEIEQNPPQIPSVSQPASNGSTQPTPTTSDESTGDNFNDAN
ncbi:MAG: hypothetical protein U0930_26355 [Pirellulales bacterium]